MQRRGNITVLILGVLIGFLLALMFRGGNKKEAEAEISHTMIIEKIESLGNLEVLKYSIQDIVEYKKIRQWFPNAKAAILISGEIISCVDLPKISPEDIYTSGDSIRLNLPSPEICHVKIDHSKSRVYDVKYGLWESIEIVDEAYKSAEKQLKERAQELDIKPKSRDNAVNLLTPILNSMGFKHVLISFDNRRETTLSDR